MDTPNRPYRARYCWNCDRRLRQPARGRPRKTCSDACRTALHRRLYGTERYEARQTRRGRAAYRRFVARYGDLGPGAWRIKLRLEHGLPLAYCRECGRPYLPDLSTGSRQTCSSACYRRYNRRCRAVAKAIYTYGLLPDREVYDRINDGRWFPVCAHCHKPFIPKTRGRPPKYCSKSCRQKAAYYRAHPPIVGYATCPECKREFPDPQPASPSEVCSHACYQRTRRRRGKRLMHWCAYCNEPFHKPWSQTQVLLVEMQSGRLATPPIRSRCTGLHTASNVAGGFPCISPERVAASGSIVPRPVRAAPTAVAGPPLSGEALRAFAAHRLPARVTRVGQAVPVK